LCSLKWAEGGATRPQRVDLTREWNEACRLDEANRHYSDCLIAFVERERGKYLGGGGGCGDVSSFFYLFLSSSICWVFLDWERWRAL
jgi:hypothetical protein